MFFRIVTNLVAAAICLALSTIGPLTGPAMSEPTGWGRVYDSDSGADDLGRMRLGESKARFQKMAGVMHLQFAGIARFKDMDRWDELYDDVRMYRIVNANRYFRLNYGRNRYCQRPLRWLGIAPRPGGYEWVVLYDSANPLDNESDFNTGYAMTYVLHEGGQHR